MTIKHSFFFTITLFCLTLNAQTDIKSSSINIKENIVVDSVVNQYYVSGIYKWSLGDYNGAIVDYNSLIKLRPSIEGIYYHRGRAEFDSKQYSNAIADYCKEIEMNPKIIDNADFNIYFHRGLAKAELQDFRGAISDFTQAIISFPKVANIKLFNNEDVVYAKRAYAKTMVHDNIGALKDYDKAIEFNAKNGGYFYLRGLVKLMLNQIESGCIDLSKAGELGESKSYDAIKTYCN